MFLSDAVRKIVVDDLERCKGKEDSLMYLFDDDDAVLHWERLVHRDLSLPQVIDGLLHPLAWTCFARLNQKASLFRASLLDWFSPCSQRLCDLFFLSSSTASTSEQLVCILLLTSQLERALSDVYVHHTKKKPPPLFRDLLEQPEMSELLGGPTVCNVVRALVGHPTGCNLRNVVWHGFNVFFSQPFSVWLSCLMVVSASLGEIVGSFARRPLVKKLRQKHLLRGEEKNQIVVVVDDVLSQCSAWIPKEYAIVLRDVHLQILHEDPQRRWEGLSALFVSLEHVLRCAYCDLNQLPQMKRTADNATYYTTMETFILPRVPPDCGEEKNALLSVLGKGGLQLMWDLFFLPSGPRIRDRMSHGELDISSEEALPLHLCRFIYFACMGLICAVARGSPNVPCGQFVASYVSRCHPKSMAIYTLLDLRESLLRMENLMDDQRKHHDDTNEDLRDLLKVRLLPSAVREKASQVVGSDIQHLVGERILLDSIFCEKDAHELASETSVSCQPRFESACKWIRHVAKEMFRASKALMAEVEALLAHPCSAKWAFRLIDSVELFGCIAWCMYRMLSLWLLHLNDGIVSLEKLEKGLVVALSFAQNLNKSIGARNVPAACEKFDQVLKRFDGITILHIL